MNKNENLKALTEAMKNLENKFTDEELIEIERYLCYLSTDKSIIKTDFLNEEFLDGFYKLVKKVNNLYIGKKLLLFDKDKLYHTTDDIMNSYSVIESPLEEIIIIYNLFKTFIGCVYDQIDKMEDRKEEGDLVYQQHKEQFDRLEAEAKQFEAESDNDEEDEETITIGVLELKLLRDRIYNSHETLTDEEIQELETVFMSMDSEQLIDLQNKDMFIIEFCDRFCKDLFDLKPNPKTAEQLRNMLINKIKYPTKLIKLEFEKTLDRCLNDVYDLELKNIDLGSKGEKTIFDLNEEDREKMRKKGISLNPNELPEIKIDEESFKLIMDMKTNDFFSNLTNVQIPEFPPIIKK